MPITYKEILRVLIDYDYTMDRQNGSHQIWKRDDITQPIVVPKHKELKPWTAKSILQDIAQDQQTTIQYLKSHYGLKL
jgi:predicted RNA binding protein YcfA (HicA-like mRNA interferase family)